jgi:hypothetical protein
VRTVRASVVLLCVAALAGCGPHRARVHKHPAGPPPARPTPHLPVTDRGAVEPDVSGLPTDPAPSPARPDQYRRLTAAECRALAVANAPLADEFDRHPDNLPPGHPLAHFFRTRPELAGAGRLVRGYAADELRNRAAGDALDDFFRLAQAEGQFDLLAKAHAELRTQLAAAEKALAAGLRDRADTDELRRQLFDLEAQLAKLEAGIGGLNASLRGRLGLPTDDPFPIWPDDPLRVRPEDVDAAQAVATGLYYRPDLNLLRALLADGAGGELTRAVLTGVNPLLGPDGRAPGPNPLAGLVGGLAHLSASRERQRPEPFRDQVTGVLAARERQAEAEIRAAVANVHGNRSAVAARSAAVRVLSARVADLEKRERQGLNVTAELTRARLELLTAKGELLRAAADWHVAEARLRQAMGLLARE